MADINSPPNPRFLAENALREAMELLFYGYRGFTGEADRILDGYDFGRAHHRVLYFVKQNPDITVSELLAILKIRKQSLARVLRQLIDQDYVEQREGDEDRRRRHLSLTDKGADLERQLAEAQFLLLRAAFAEAGPEAVDGFRRVMDQLHSKSLSRL